MARAYAKRLGAELALVDKRRPKPDSVEIMNIIGDVEGKNVILFDDVLTTGRTLCQAAQGSASRRARDLRRDHPRCAVSGRLRAHREVAHPRAGHHRTLDHTSMKCRELHRASVAGLLGEAVQRIPRSVASARCSFETRHAAKAVPGGGEMAVISLSGPPRQARKGGARKARAAGGIPGVLYGTARPGGGERRGPAISRSRCAPTRRQRDRDLAVDGGEYTALIRDVQYDPISHGILHLDFQHISLTESIEVNVNVHLVVSRSASRTARHPRAHLREVEVRCLPTAIPSAIDVDVSALNVGDSVHVRDLKVIDVTVLTDPRPRSPRWCRRR